MLNILRTPDGAYTAYLACERCHEPVSMAEALGLFYVDCTDGGISPLYHTLFVVHPACQPHWEATYHAGGLRWEARPLAELLADLGWQFPV